MKAFLRRKHAERDVRAFIYQRAPVISTPAINRMIFQFQKAGLPEFPSDTSQILFFINMASTTFAKEYYKILGLAGVKRTPKRNNISAYSAVISQSEMSIFKCSVEYTASLIRLDVQANFRFDSLSMADKNALIRIGFLSKSINDIQDSAPLSISELIGQSVPGQYQSSSAVAALGIAIKTLESMDDDDLIIPVLPEGRIIMPGLTPYDIQHSQRPSRSTEGFAVPRTADYLDTIFPASAATQYDRTQKIILDGGIDALDGTECKYKTIKNFYKNLRVI